MNYLKIYEQLCTRGQNRSKESGIFYEKHHIIPKSMGGSNKNENLVKLSAREHFICHRLLVKMTEGHNKVKMSYAIRTMMNRENQYQQRYKISSKIYESIIEETKATIGNNLKGSNNPYYGKKHSEEVRQKMREKRALQIMPARKGKVYSEETLSRWREANKKQFTDLHQIEIRRTKCNKIQGMKIYHNSEGKTKYYIEETQPSGWVKGRVTTTKGGGNQ